MKLRNDTSHFKEPAHRKASIKVLWKRIINSSLYLSCFPKKLSFKNNRFPLYQLMDLFIIFTFLTETQSGL